MDCVKFCHREFSAQLLAIQRLERGKIFNNLIFQTFKYKSLSELTLCIGVLNAELNWSLTSPMIGAEQVQQRTEGFRGYSLSNSCQLLDHTELLLLRQIVLTGSQYKQ